MDATFERGRLGTEGAGPPAGERVDVVVRVSNVVIEQVVSSADPSCGAEPVVYDQPQDEWVFVMAGSATLEAGGRDGPEAFELDAGDWVLLPARCRHRLLAAEPGTRWLAVHVHPDDPADGGPGRSVVAGGD